MGRNRGTHNSSSRRRNDRSPNIARLISSMLAIIPKFHLSLEVNDPLVSGAHVTYCAPWFSIYIIYAQKKVLKEGGG
jgi:hypothetical protein